ncbi:MAG: NAD(P)/FAD-dependent oxidoreductase [Desulfobacteraceae bacterium]|nr:MAG: NAD(P)/FAD-dependent oxidoreductase [Desulfobacteraceae bacterium]
MKKVYDVVVIGVGPAGASAGRSAALSGMRVLMVERKTVVGVPVRCAEYIPAPLMGELGLGHGFVVQRVRGMRTFLPDGTEKTTLTPGLMIRRDLLDQAICSSACDAGAELMLGTSALAFDGNMVVLKDQSGHILEVESEVVIGADGPHSTVGRHIGSTNEHLLAAIQVRVPLTRRLDQTEVYFDRAFYGGYGWLFPKNEEANVGLGILKAGSEGIPLRHALDRFLERLANSGKILNRPLGWTAGWVPAEPLRRIVKERYMLAGDAAGHTNPITGAGVFQAVTAGNMAGRWAAKAVRENDPSLLAGYEEEWRDLFEETHQRAFRRRLLLEREWERLDQVIRKCWVAFREYYKD